MAGPAAQTGSSLLVSRLDVRVAGLARPRGGPLPPVTRCQRVKSPGGFGREVWGRLPVRWEPPMRCERAFPDVPAGVRERSLSDDLHKMRIGTRRTELTVLQ